MRAGRRAGGLVAVVVAVVLATALAPAGPSGSTGAAPLIGCDRATERVTLTGSARLDPGCTYTGGFEITSSDVTLDCRGARIRDTTGTGGNAIAVWVDVDADLHDVTIRGCRVEGFQHAVDLERRGVGRLAAGHEHDHHLRGVVISNLVSTGARGVGIYVHPYVSRTTIRRSTVTGAGSTGIYLDAGSRRAWIDDNLIAGNGFVENGPGGKNITVAGFPLRYWGPGREGIAVDGSTDNVIRRNRIVGNSAGGVFLYTNCGEYVHDDPDNWLEHRVGAERNLIAENRIAGGGTGVWVASRMGENVYPMDCSDEPYVAGPFLVVTLDRAPYTTVRDNVVSGADFGVRVEDDHTVVARNRFTSPDPADTAVVVGTPYRTSALDRPVAHTVLSRNTSAIAGNRSPFRWVEGVSDVRFAGNLALGRPSAPCRAPSVPRGPFVMVYAVAPQDPTAPPQPPPPYDIPSLGVLPACP